MYRYIILIILLIVLISVVRIIAGFKNSKQLVELSYSVMLKDIPNKTNKIAIWIPIPRNDSIQQLENINVLNNLEYTILTENNYGNKFLYFKYIKNKNKNELTNITVSFRVHRKIYEKIESEDDTKISRFLLPDKLIPNNVKIAEESHMVTEGVSDSLKKAKLIFNHIVDTIEYDKSGTGWGQGDAVYVCNVRKGNCTDFHSLFIGEVRSLGTSKIYYGIFII